MTDATATINATNLGCSITCKDLPASLRFYRDAIGFAVAQTFEIDGKVAGAVIGAGDCRIVLNQDDGKLGWDRVKGQGFYLQINEPADRPWGARMFQFKDLDGFKLGVSFPLAG
jgi:catechol 2,3-dioxygenase-like lactoylglutathione lyase family enzyme